MIALSATCRVGKGGSYRYTAVNEEDVLILPVRKVKMRWITRRN